MGASITVALISCGYQVLLKDLMPKNWKRDWEKIDCMLQSLVKKGCPWLSREAKETRQNGSRLRDSAATDLAIEAVLEKIDVKADVFSQLE